MMINIIGMIYNKELSVLPNNVSLGLQLGNISSL